MRYRRRPEYVEAERFTDPNNPPILVEQGRDGIFRLQTGGMPQVIKVGAWVVTDERGVITKMADANFQEMYEEAET